MLESVFNEGQAGDELSFHLESHVGNDHVHGGLMVAGEQVFAGISCILLKRILDLQEVLEFYEMNMFDPLQEEDPGDLLDSCGDSHCTSEQMHLEFSCVPVI